MFSPIAAQRPLVLLLEDLHWAEPNLIELLESLLEAQAPLFELATARPEITDMHPGLVVEGDRRTVITLHELSPEESDALVVELVALQVITVVRGRARRTLQLQGRVVTAPLVRVAQHLPHGCARRVERALSFDVHASTTSTRARVFSGCWSISHTRLYGFQLS